MNIAVYDDPVPYGAYPMVPSYTMLESW